MFGLKNSTESSAQRLLEEKLYEQVAQGLAQGKRREGIWAKAMADSNGQEDKAASLYIQYHVQALKDEMTVKNKGFKRTTESEEKETARKPRSAYNSDLEYIIDTIVQNTHDKKSTNKTIRPSESFISNIQRFIAGSAIFIVALFIGMLVGGLVLNILKPDLASPDFDSVAFLGWSFGFASLYFYLKKEWLKYIALGAFIIFVIQLVK